MKPILARIILAAGFAMGGVASAFAAPPTSVDGTSLSWTCPNIAEPVVLTLTGSVKTIDLPGGRQIVASPNLRVTVTAPSGNTLSYVITGASRFELLPDGNTKVTSTGRNLVLVPEVPGQHGPGLFLTTGNIHFTVDAQGNEVELFSGTGTVLDVCQALA